MPWTITFWLIPVQVENDQIFTSIDIHLLPFRFSPKEYWETYTNEVINYLAFWQQPHADISTETNHWEALTDVCETGHCTSGSVEHRHLATGLEPIRPILVESNSLKLEFKLILCNPRFLLDS